MNSFNNYKMWGEIEGPIYEFETQEEPDLSEVIHQAQQPDCLSNYDIPSRWNETKEIVLPCMESRMLYASDLHNYKKSMADVIQDAELAAEFNLVLQKNEPDPVFPEKPDVKEVILGKRAISFFEKKPNNFTKGKGDDPPYLNECTRKSIEQQCIATLLTQIGFKDSYEDIMDTLVDVLEIFMKNLCGQLRYANDSLLTGRITSFPDIVEEVLSQSGIGGLKGLHEYYETRIRRYETVLEKRCAGLATRFCDLVTPVTDIRPEKSEDGFNDQDIPEVHFTAVDGEGDYLQPFLESGFQMLNSLEQDAEFAGSS